MELVYHYHESAVNFLARVFLGCLFFFQGYDAVFKIKIKNVIEVYQSSFSNKGIPKIVTSMVTWFTSCSALVCGILLIVGLFEYAALYVLGVNIIITAIGLGINSPMWDLQFVFPRLILILFLLIIPFEWKTWSVDSLFFKEYCNSILVLTK